MREYFRTNFINALRWLFTGLSRLTVPKAQQALTFITGANSLYFSQLLNLLQSLWKYESESPVIVYDLGLTNEERQELKIKFPAIQIHTFNFSAYPAYFNIKINVGEFAWKPIIIQQEFERATTNIMWLDAACVVTNRLDCIRLFLQWYGFYSLYSWGNVQRWTHPDTIRLLKADTLKAKRMVSGGVVAFRRDSPFASELVNEWKEYAYRKEYLAPEGSNFDNHRQDQSLITLLFYQKHPTQPFWYRYGWGILTHQGAAKKQFT
ncbi:MAG: DUF1647 domain-containing protein [Siphonobacter sp.]